MDSILIPSLLLAGIQVHAVAGTEQAGSIAEQVAPSVERQIHESLRALPESLRDGATVIGYDTSGELVTLKQGSNGMTCWADDPRP